MLALEKGKLVSKGSKKSSKPSENGTSSKKVEKSKTEKKVEKSSKTEKSSKSTEKSAGSPKKPKNTIIIPNEKQIEKFLVKLIKQSNLEQLTMKQVSYRFRFASG